MKNREALSPTRSRPELKCITDKKYLYMDPGDPSPARKPARHLSQNYQTCDIPDQGGGNQQFAGFSSYINQYLTAASVIESRYEQNTRERSNSNHKMSSFHSRSKSNVKAVKSDLKKGSFSDKQNIPKKGSTSKILLKKNEYRPLSPFLVKVANRKPGFVSVRPKSKENKEEVIQPWRKYMRDLGLNFQKSKIV